jgi:hypothetical protein
MVTPKEAQAMLPNFNIRSGVRFWYRRTNIWSRWFHKNMFACFDWVAPPKAVLGPLLLPSILVLVHWTRLDKKQYRIVVCITIDWVVSFAVSEQMTNDVKFICKKMMSVYELIRAISIELQQQNDVKPFGNIFQRKMITRKAWSSHFIWIWTLLIEESHSGVMCNFPIYSTGPTKIYSHIRIGRSHFHYSINKKASPVHISGAHNELRQAI